MAPPPNFYFYPLQKKISTANKNKKKMLLVLPSSLVKRLSVSWMRDFFKYQILHAKYRMSYPFEIDILKGEEYHLIYPLYYVGERWHLTYDIWHMTCYIWHVTCNTWYVTCDTWQYIYDFIFYFIFFSTFNFFVLSAHLCRVSVSCKQDLFTWFLMCLLHLFILKNSLCLIPFSNYWKVKFS